MEKMTSQSSLNQDQELNYNILEKKVFFKDGKNIYIGGELLVDPVKGILRDQAKSLLSSQLYEVLDATITNEGINLLTQASTVEQLQYAKALLYWNKILKKTVNSLSE